MLAGLLKRRFHTSITACAHRSHPAAAAEPIADVSSSTSLNEPLLPPVYSPRTLRRQEQKRQNAHYMSAEEFFRARYPFPAPVFTKLPLAYRSPSPAMLIRLLRQEEKQRIINETPSHRDRFVTGDRIAVTRYVSLTDKAKVERVYGRVIERRGDHALTASFVIRNSKAGEAYDMRIPLYSPFIVRIDVLERGPKRFVRLKQREIRQMAPAEYETAIKVALPRTAAEKRTSAVVQKSSGAHRNTLAKEQKKRTAIQDATTTLEAPKTHK